MSLNIEDGRLMVRYKVDSGPPKEKEIGAIVNDGKDHLVYSLSLFL